MTEWKQQKYGDGEYLDLGHGLQLSVSYEGMSRLTENEPKYNVTIFGARLMKRMAGKEEGRKLAERTARRWLESALEQLPLSADDGRAESK